LLLLKNFATTDKERVKRIRAKSIKAGTTDEHPPLLMLRRDKQMDTIRLKD
jgi:hypothetical protein